ncbi:MAG: GIY-YIG nuclease family protein [Thiotrichaceae bacterium]|nr:GIY-YIG nuclease family protein [Thiotrichaceae bacterium]MBL1260856.1 GIY-YIG nuclease family protein [Thiotrichaceae bacterium]PCI10486.1 MAG: endonuclease [Thiotrichales bacterium]PCI13026.1 MAG: endonuclease [Thiotrichales bacterium]
MPDSAHSPNTHRVLWHVYIVKCHDNTLYTGITTDIERRIKEHNSSPLGARYTRSRRPVELHYYENVNSRSEALKREIEIKKLPSKDKRSLSRLTTAMTVT